MKKLKVIFVVAVLVLLSSCTSVTDRLFASKDLKEKEIAALRVEFDKKLVEKQREMAAATTAIVANKDAQIRAVANGLYGADKVFSTILAPTRTDLLTNNYVNESWAAIGHLQPDYETTLKINERLKIELDEAKTSLESLRKTHQAVVSENQKLVDATKIWQDKLSALTKEIGDIKSEYSAKLDAKQTELGVIKDQLIAVETERANDRAAIQALKTKISSICGIIVLACLAGAIWSPIGKTGFIYFGVAVGLAGAAIWVIPAWAVIVAIAVVALGLVAYALRKHYVESNTAKNVYRALESVKTKAKETWDTVVKPEIEEWQTKRNKHGEIVPDAAAIAHVDSVLIEAGDK